jgi:multidrug transporter EmrE-like cation transporter
MNASKAAGYLYIALTVLFTVYGQLIIKWRLHRFGPLPGAWADKLQYFVAVLKDPYIISSFIAAFAASLTWMAAVTKFEISFAYPFMSAAFVLVLLGSAVFFGESVSLPKILGLALILAGIMISSRA